MEPVITHSTHVITRIHTFYTVITSFIGRKTGNYTMSSVITRFTPRHPLTHCQPFPESLSLITESTSLWWYGCGG